MQQSNDEVLEGFNHLAATGTDKGADALEVSPARRSLRAAALSYNGFNLRHSCSNRHDFDLDTIAQQATDKQS